MMELLAVACLSVAAKMEEVDVPILLDLQVRKHYLVILLNFISIDASFYLIFELTV